MFGARIAVGNFWHVLIACTWWLHAHVLATHAGVEATIWTELDTHTVAKTHYRCWLLFRSCLGRDIIRRG